MILLHGSDYYAGLLAEYRGCLPLLVRYLESQGMTVAPLTLPYVGALLSPSPRHLMLRRNVHHDAMVCPVPPSA
jgi:hypothetical protein